MIGSGFEGSFMGCSSKISAAAVMECKICWTPYDPAEGDETRQIPPGTPFLALPADWKCPVCDGTKDQFMVLDDTGAGSDSGTGSGKAADNPEAAMIDAVARLEAEFREIHNAKMRDVPFSNKALNVQSVGFRLWEGRFLGVLVAPWLMNLTLLPGPDDDWSSLVTGETEIIEFPSGPYQFIHSRRERVGGYKGCSLFSPMGEFSSQLQATDVARAVMQALFDEANREEMMPAAPVGPPAEPETPQTAPEPLPSRRAVITGGLRKPAEEPRP